MNAAPLIVTARLDAASFAVLEALRQRHFPANLNKIPAHLTLFHQLPGVHEREVFHVAREVCAGLAPFDLEPDGWLNLGRGVAARYRSIALVDLHRELSRAWTVWLSKQDRHRLRPHVTIQNKVTPEAAKDLLHRLMNPPPACRIDGVAIWRYLGGPWESLGACAFGRAAQ